MAGITKYMKRQISALRGFLTRRTDPFRFLRTVLPTSLFRDLNYLPYLKKVPLFLLIGLVIVSFIVTSMPHIFLI